MTKTSGCQVFGLCQCCVPVFQQVAKFPVCDTVCGDLSVASGFRICAIVGFNLLEGSNCVVLDKNNGLNNLPVSYQMLKLR